MTEPLPPIERCYGVRDALLARFARCARRSRFRGETPEAFLTWQTETRMLLAGLLGLDKLERCPLDARCTKSVTLPEGIIREHWTIQTEPGVTMPFYLLIPPGANRNTRPFLCPPGHGGAGKYSVAGLREFEAVAERIDFYNYDYGLQLARLGYVALCPDCRGFGERREELGDTRALPQALKGDCVKLAHMALPLGLTVIGMQVWDLMRLTDYLAQRGDWAYNEPGCLGFSGGGMQTLYFAALDGRVRLAVVSGYLYGVRDSLLILNENCACNYVPRLWEHLDMGDVASLIAPRPLWVQSCREDRLNGARGLVNVEEQVAIVREAYRLLDAEDRLLHEVCEGPHRWHGEKLSDYLKKLYPYTGEPISWTNGNCARRSSPISASL